MGLKTLRRQAGYTLHELAKKSGVNYMKIHQIETGYINVKNITLRTAQKLATALNCEPKDFMIEDEEIQLRFTRISLVLDNSKGRVEHVVW